MPSAYSCSWACSRVGSVYLRLQYSGLASTLSLSPKQASNVLHLAVGVPDEFAKITDDLQQHCKYRSWARAIVASIETVGSGLLTFYNLICTQLLKQH